MSKKKRNAIDEEVELRKNVENILLLKESEQNPKDKIFIEYLNYIFKKGSTQQSIVLPVRKRDGIQFKYLKDFIDILHMIFKKSKNERDILYQTEKSGLSFELNNKFKSLELFIKKRNIQFYKDKLFDKILFIMYTYYHDLNKTLSDSLTFYSYCLGLIIPTTNMIRIVLYNFLKIKFKKFFEKFKFNQFCPNFDSQNCLNLILLFFQNITNNKFEILVIYALLIFKYEYIFRGYEQDINAKILEDSVEKTYVIVKEKTLNNCIILEYIFSYFIQNLKNNINNSQGNNENKRISTNNIINIQNNEEEPDNEEEIKINDNNEIPNYNIKVNLSSKQKKNNVINEKSNDIMAKSNDETLNINNINENSNFNNIKKNPDISIFHQTGNKIDQKEVYKQNSEKEQNINGPKERQIDLKISKQKTQVNDVKEEISLEKIKQNYTINEKESDIPASVKIDISNNNISSDKSKRDINNQINLNNYNNYNTDNKKNINDTNKNELEKIDETQKNDSTQSSEIQRLIKDLEKMKNYYGRREERK